MAEASSPTTCSSTALSSPASETPDDVSASSKLGSATTPTESSTKVDKGGTEVKELSAKAMEDRKKREKMLSALEGRMKGTWKGKKVSGKLRRQYGFWGGARERRGPGVRRRGMTDPPVGEKKTGQEEEWRTHSHVEPNPRLCGLCLGSYVYLTHDAYVQILIQHGCTWMLIMSPGHRPTD